MIRPDHLVIYLSGRCNLACHYCYARGISRKIISPSKLRSALSAFISAGHSRPKFTILGGEPLLCRETLYLALSEIRKIFRDAPVHIFTNGLLLKKGEAASLLKRGIKLTVSLDGVVRAGRPCAIPNLPRPLRKRVSVSAVVCPENAGELLPNMLYLLGLGFESLAWSPDIAASWDKASLARLRNSAKALLLEYLRRLKSGNGVWELANGHEAVALVARDEKPGPCRNITLAPDGFFYPCDKMICGPEELISPFRIGPDGSGRKKFFGLAMLRSSQFMCRISPWAAARFKSGSGGVPRGQAAAREVASRWLISAARAGVLSRAFRNLHGI